MSIKSFKFVSPGVFINEIDNSFVPKSAEAIGPVVIGRSTRGLAMQPVKVESYSQFVEMFGDTVPGGAAGNDVYRDGNLQSPMYGTYAAKAFLNANVAPLTYVRLLGQQDTNATSAGYAGWQTTSNINATAASNGGAYGLWVWPSSSGNPETGISLGTGQLAAVWYLDTAATIQLTGAVIAGYHSASSPLATWSWGSNQISLDGTSAGIGVVIGTDADALFNIELSTSIGGVEKIKFGFDDTSDMFIRKRFNTNPQLASTQGTFFANDAYKQYWLGETYEQDLRDGTTDIVGNGTSKIGAALHGVLLPIALISDLTKSPAKMINQESREAEAGWFIGQDLGAASEFYPQNMQKLFKLKGRGHGEWLQLNAKVSIANIRVSQNPASDYGTFSVIIRALSDTDNNIQVYERFDNLTLDPTSPDFIARRIGDKFTQWDATSRRLKTYGEYPNNSKFVRVEMASGVEEAQTNAALLPYGYWGPPKFTTLTDISGGIDSVTGTDDALDGRFIYWKSGAFPATPATNASYEGGSLAAVLSCSFRAVDADGCGITGSLAWPVTRVRSSSLDGGLGDPTNAYFGFQTTRSPDSTINDRSVGQVQRLLYAGYNGGTAAGVDQYSYVFSMDDIVNKAADGAYNYVSGSRKAGTSVDSYKTLLAAGYRNFTAPFWGGFDGFNIKLPDPLYNAQMSSTSTNLNSSPYYTWKRAIDTVADPEQVDLNLMVAPGLTVDGLTAHMIDVCQERADALALIDLANVYIPPHEAYYSSKVNRIGTTPTNAATALLDRRIDSSYGATFYPWVQTRDAATGALLWVPPTVAMAGVLASSQAASDVWFAPAGFNRGGLSDGAAGIPVTAVTERLTSKDRDTLYEARINPIASFPNSGIVVFGQKTLQASQSALDRINVRRLVIYLKKQISILSTEVLFEQNVQATWNRFKSLIEPLLANVKVNFGITEYKLVLDESTTTDDLIDQNILYAKIMVKPARAIEYIAIDFVISSTGASFDD